MKCPYCENPETKVLDSRTADNDSAIRRRRACHRCNKRFTTYERVDKIRMKVVKRDGRREDFSRDKIISGIYKACDKRKVSVNEINDLVNKIETYLSNSIAKEVKSTEIGELIMQKLRLMDEVAYIRFASVYRNFKDLDMLNDELQELRSKKGKQ